MNLISLTNTLFRSSSAYIDMWSESLCPVCWIHFHKPWNIVLRFFCPEDTWTLSPLSLLAPDILESLQTRRYSKISPKSVTTTFPADRGRFVIFTVQSRLKVWNGLRVNTKIILRIYQSFLNLPSSNKKFDIKNFFIKIFCNGRTLNVQV